VSRAYDNSGRLEEAARTRERIVDAGCSLARESDVRDWGGVTIAAVAERAGVSERTVYRHLGSEDGLRQAVMATIEQSAGIDLAGLDLDGVADAAALIFEQLAAFRPPAQTDLDPTLREAGERQRAALLGAVAAARPDWSDDEQQALAAVLDVLWSPAAHERLVTGWSMTPAEATSTLTKAIRTITT
jgi:AcrR family transcriptional regulator